MNVSEGGAEDRGPPLRIVYLLAYFHPVESGAERQALAQGAELVRLGHRVDVVTQRIAGLPDDDLVRGVRVHRWIRPSKRGPLFAISFVAGVIAALRRLRVEVGLDLIHTHQALWEGVAAGLARQALGRTVPTIVQPASSGYYGEAEELLRTKGAAWLRRLVIRNDAFVAISADIERQWIDLGVAPEKMVRIASGVDGSHFAPGSVLPDFDATLPARPRVIFTGRIHPQKNLDVLVDAWPQVFQATGASLILVGQGPERGRLEARAETLGLAQQIRFLGPVDDVADALRAADLFVLPSVAEGMSNSLLEAMASALPCVASNIGGNQDLLGPSETGLLVSGNDPRDWAVALVTILNDPARCQKLGASGRRRVEEEFAIRPIVNRYLALYRELLKPRSAG